MMTSKKTQGSATFRSTKCLLGAVFAGIGSLAFSWLALCDDNPSGAEVFLSADPPVYEFGIINQGKHKAEFRLTNHAAFPLEIDAIEKSCSCAEVIASKRPILPGESELVTCTWDTRGHRGNSRTSFLVFYTESDKPGLHPIQLSMHGVIQADFDFSPKVIEFSADTHETVDVIFAWKDKGVEKPLVTEANCIGEAFNVNKKSNNLISLSFEPKLYAGVPTDPVLIVGTSSEGENRVRIPIQVNGH